MRNEALFCECRERFTRPDWADGGGDILTPSGHVWVCGWTKGSFLVAPDLHKIGPFEQYVGMLSHRGTGAALYWFGTPDWACEAADIIEVMADWQSMTNVGDARDPVWLSVWERVGTAITRAGFRALPFAPYKGRALIVKTDDASARPPAAAVN